MKKVQSLIGKRYKVPKAHAKGIAEADKSIRATKSLIRSLSLSLHQDRESMWKTIQDAIPEIDAEKYVYNYYVVTEEVVCSRVMWEKED